jgi:hypothetical protein
MSATLVWASSGNGTKTGTAIANFFDDLDTLVTSKSGDATFFWEKAGKNSGSTPYYLLLRRKDGSAGRIAIIHWSSAPAANNVAILDGAPTTGVFIAWFPAGTGTTLSNLTAASGTICGTDTGCVKVSMITTLTTVYAASFVPFYMDSAEAMYFGFQNPASSQMYMFGAGDILVDSADVVYGGTVGYNTANLNNFASTTPIMPWATTAPNAGAATSSVRTNYGSSNRAYFQAFAPSGLWGTQAIGVTDVLTDTSVNGVGFIPIQLMAPSIKLGGLPLKLRQIAIGPVTSGPFTPYQVTGPTVKARQFTNLTAGSTTGSPWFINDKL